MATLALAAGTRAANWWELDAPTPYLALRIEEVARKYFEFRRTMPEMSIYYAVKANPATQVLQTLATLGCNFDVASGNELRQCLAIGVEPERISFGNTAKRSADIRFAYQAGVRHFTADSVAELEKLASLAPGAKVTIRLLVECVGADWPLSRKFGCVREEALRLFVLAKALGLVPFALSFHVGSQQCDPNAWRAPIQEASEIFAELRAAGIALENLNLGGGFPAGYVKPVPVLDAYAKAIRAALQESFGDTIPRLMIEPGRGLVADAAVLVSEVVLVSQKAQRWVTIDCGIFGGLIETLGEAIRYRIETTRDGDPTAPAVIAGPTCDSTDILYERTPYPLPASLTHGDRLYFLNAGAYTYTCAANGFNGFEPLECYCI